MTYCPNCHKEIDEDAIFCEECGTRIVETVFCWNCGEKIDASLQVCPHCGADTDPFAAEKQEKPAKSKNMVKGKNIGGKSGKKLAAVGAIGLAAVIGLSSVLNGSAKKNEEQFYMYIQDGEMYCLDSFGSEPWRVTSEMMEYPTYNGDLYGLDNYFFDYTNLSVDGKYLFYLDNIEDVNGEGSLYYRKIGTPVEKAVEIHRGHIIDYMIHQDGKGVTYRDGFDLYRSDLKKSTKIAEDVASFLVGSDGDTVRYVTRENKLYIWTKRGGSERIGKDVTFGQLFETDDLSKICYTSGDVLNIWTEKNGKEVISDDIDDILHVSEDLNNIYYLQENSVYHYTEKNGSEEIITDVSDVYRVYETGEIYFSRKTSSGRTLSEFIYDDMRDADSRAVKPKMPVYPDRWDYPSRSSYEVELFLYDLECASYDMDYAAYEAAERRNNIREIMHDKTLDFGTSALYYFDGTKEKLVTDTMENVVDRNFDEARIIIKACEGEVDERINLSEIEFAEDVAEILSARRAEASKYYIVEKDHTEKMGSAVSEVCFAEDGDAVYYTEDGADGVRGLYRAEIKKGKLGKPKFIGDAKEVVNGQSDGEMTIYYDRDDYDPRYADLYINGVLVDQNVLHSRVDYDKEAKAVYYYKDYSMDSYDGTLKVYRDGIVSTIAYDVQDYEKIGKEKYLCLCDYEWDDYEGTLYLCDEQGNAEVLAEDVTMLHVISNGQKGGHLFGYF